MFAKGYNGQMEFDGNTLIISRKGGLAILSQGLKGDKRIPSANITSIQFKNAGALTNGYIQVATAAGESRGGLSSATSDENTVIFTKGQQPAFEVLREALQSAVENISPNNGPAISIESPLDALKKLKELLDLGAITQAEFDEKKISIMGQI